MSDWKVSTGRITLFLGAPTLPQSVSALEVFRGVWNADPDNFQKPTNPLIPAIAIGRRGALQVACSIHSSRIDFNFGMAASTPTGIGGIPVRLPQIEDAKQFNAELEKVIKIIGEGYQLGSVIRFALSIQFQKQSKDFVEANGGLLAVLPKNYKIGITDEEDFLLQVNQPYVSEQVEGMKINAITKWSVDRIQVLNFSFQAGNPMQPNVPPILEKPQQFYAAGVVSELNSPLDSSSLISGKQQASLLDEALRTIPQILPEIAINVRGFKK